jgi:hypothetical protein
MSAAIGHDKIVVVFDLCSSSQIIEDLLLSNRFDRYETFLTCVKRWLMNWTEQHSQVNGHFELYKFTGDGWILLFPATTNGKALINSMYSLCEMINAELARHIVPSLSSLPAVLGADARRRTRQPAPNDDERTRGIRGSGAERRVQVAERGQGTGFSSSQRRQHLCELLQGARVGAPLQRSARAREHAIQNRVHDVAAAKYPQRERIRLPKIDFTVDSAGQAMPWPTRETQGWNCARSNWQSPP